ncbi:MAG: MT-A70 family methyltransferase [Geminicoccaceae bacterium]
MTEAEGPASLAPPPRVDYRVIYADPPWHFQTYSKRGKGRSAEAHYDCMSLDRIKSLPVADWAADNALLLMWTTDPLLPQALSVIESWGFTYKTVGFYWAKLNKGAKDRLFTEQDLFVGMGFWTRANPEMCLLATKGSPKRQSAAVRRLVMAKRREHSRKPEEVYRRIEALSDGPYLELFARDRRRGWDVWGREIDLFALGQDVKRRVPSSLAGVADNLLDGLGDPQ